MKYTDKQTITETEYCQLAGLLLLGQEHDRQVQIIVRAMEKILGERPNEGFSSEAIWNKMTVDDLLSKLKLAVTPDAPDA